VGKQLYKAIGAIYYVSIYIYISSLAISTIWYFFHTFWDLKSLFTLVPTNGPLVQIH